MIISKTPFRISFLGGGTDYPDYYSVFGGSVLSTSINQYIYITIRPVLKIHSFKYRIAYSKLEICDSINEIEHPVVRESLKYLNIEQGLEINIIGDLPAKTGIGSSSSFTVGFLHALHTLKGETVGKEQLAMEAIHIEQNLLKERVGVQDQLAAAHGGFNYMQFQKDDFKIKKIHISTARLNNFQNNLVMFYTGLTRFASEILAEQLQNTKDQKINSELEAINKMVLEGVEIIQDENISLDNFGSLLHEGWTLKKKLSNAISNKFLDDIYLKAMQAGALGGKLLGAGGGGFFLLYVPIENQMAVKKALHNLIEVSFTFENDGSTIIHNSHSN
jgi:D-glycero-alpha-D-manno-heptose-7-phosphate kinase